MSDEQYIKLGKALEKLFASQANDFRVEINISRPYNSKKITTLQEFMNFTKWR